jgi:hypothetical protein
MTFQRSLGMPPFLEPVDKGASETGFHVNMSGSISSFLVLARGFPPRAAFRLNSALCFRDFDSPGRTAEEYTWGAAWPRVKVEPQKIQDSAALVEMQTPVPLFQPTYSFPWKAL